LANGCQSISANNFSLRTAPAAVAISALKLSCEQPPDGYALLMATSSNAVNASLYEKLSYDFIRDAEPWLLSSGPACLRPAS
jgi:hypothetical protein